MRATEFLFEYKRDITAQNYAQALVDRISKDPSMAGAYRGLADSTLEQQLAIVDGILKNFFEVIDPTQNKQYVQWLVRMYANGQIKRLEDVTASVAPVLDKFHRLKVRNLLPAHIRDINQFKTITQFYNAVGNLSEPAPELKDKGQAEEVFRNNEMRIIKPIDQAAACYYGQGTRWCTAATNSRNMFSTYNDGGPLFIVVPAQPKYPGEKYQLHFQSEQYMNEQDDPVNLNWLINERFLTLKEIVVQLAGDPNFAFSMHLLSDSKFNELIAQCAELARTVMEQVSNNPEILNDQYHAQRLHSFLMVIEDRINSNPTREDIEWTYNEHSHSNEYSSLVPDIPMLYYRFLRDGEKDLYYRYNYPRDWFNVDIKPFFNAFSKFSKQLTAAIESGKFVVENSIAWRRGNNQIKPKFRCSSGPRAGRVVSDLAQCSAHPNPAKAAKMKQTRARTKVRAAKRAKKTKRVNPLSKILQRLNKIRKHIGESADQAVKNKFQYLKEQLVAEIGHAHSLADLAVDIDFLLQSAKQIGTVDLAPVYLYTTGNQELFFLVINGALAAVVLLTNQQYIRAIKSYNKRGGLITALVSFIVRQLNRSLIISRNEELTSDGFHWLQKIIKSGGRGLSFSIDGSSIDIDRLEKEWKQARADGAAGPSEIVIEGRSKIIQKDPLLLMTTYSFFDDTENL